MPVAFCLAERRRYPYRSATLQLFDKLEVKDSHQTDSNVSNQPKYLRYRWWCFIGVRIFSWWYKVVPSIGDMSQTYL